MITKKVSCTCFQLMEKERKIGTKLLFEKCV